MQATGSFEDFQYPSSHSQLPLSTWVLRAEHSVQEEFPAAEHLEHSVWH